MRIVVNPLTTATHPRTAAPIPALKEKTMKANVKERAESFASSMNEEQKMAIRMLANDLHRLNASVVKAVDAGLSVELQRSARHHHEGGFWGDLLTPIVVKQK